MPPNRIDAQMNKNLMGRVRASVERLGEGKTPQKLRSGLPASGVEGLPEIGCPLDPGPGLGDIFSLGLLTGIASSILG